MIKHTINEPGNYRFILDKEGQEIEIMGRFSLKKRAKEQWNVEVIHAAPHTSSKTDIRGVVDNQGQAIVKGIIKVLPQATGTEAFLEEKVLLLSPQARAEAIPDLEIETDQVRCSHAATVGKIDANQLFYLQSRGLTKQKAKNLIVKGFLKPVKTGS